MDPAPAHADTPIPHAVTDFQFPNHRFRTCLFRVFPSLGPSPARDVQLFHCEADARERGEAHIGILAQQLLRKGDDRFHAEDLDPATVWVEVVAGSYPERIDPVARGDAWAKSEAPPIRGDVHHQNGSVFVVWSDRPGVYELVYGWPHTP